MARRAAFVAVSDAWSRRMGFTVGRASRSLPQRLLALRVTMGGRSNKSLDRSAIQRASHRQLARIHVACAPGQFHRPAL